MRKKILRYFGILLFALMAVVMFRPESAQAATTMKIVSLGAQKKDRTVNGAVFSCSSKYFYAKKNGQKVRLANIANGFCGYILTDGNTVYYCLSGSENDNALYRCSVTGKNKVKIASLTTKALTGRAYINYVTCFTGFYNNRLYFIDYSYGTLCSVNIQTGELRLEQKKGFTHFGAAVGKQNGKYLYLSINEGGGTDETLYVYDTSTGKLKKIASSFLCNTNGLTVDGKYVYYIRSAVKNGYYASKVYRCNANGSGKKRMTGNLQISSTNISVTLTSSSITYKDKNGATKTVTW